MECSSEKNRIENDGRKTQCKGLTNTKLPEREIFHVWQNSVKEREKIRKTISFLLVFYIEIPSEKRIAFQIPWL